MRESARSRADALLAKSEADDRALAELQERRKREAAMVSLERKLGVEERREKVRHAAVRGVPPRGCWTLD